MPKNISDNELELFTRHVTDCPDRARGRRWRCSHGCPIWCDGKRRGERFRRSLGTDWARAQKKAEQLLKEPDDAPEPVEDVTLERAQQQYEEDCRSRNCADTTVSLYVWSIATLRRFVEPGIVNVAEITGPVLERFRVSMSRTFAPSTLQTTLVNLKAFFAFCQRQGWIKDHPSIGQKGVHVVPAQPSPLTNDEVRRLLDACEMLPAFEAVRPSPAAERRRGLGGTAKLTYCRERATAFVLVMLYSGIRISDATALKRSSVDLETGRLLITPRKTRQKGKVLSLRLPPEVVQAIKALPAEEGSAEHLFYRNQTKLQYAIEYNREMLRRVFKLAKLQQHHTPHHLRDTFAKALLMGGASMRDLQFALGHSSITVTERHYAGFDPSYQRRVDDGVGRISFEPSPQS